MGMNMRNVGGRPKKLDVKLTAESLEAMLKNAWAEVEEGKNKAITQYNKQIRETKDAGDIAAIGAINVNYLKLVGDFTGRKIELAKVVKDFIQKDNKPVSNEDGFSTGLSEEDKELIANLSKPIEIDDDLVEKEHKTTLAEIQRFEDKSLREIEESDDEDNDIPF